LDTNLQNPASRFLLHVLGAAAEFERALIRERAKAGQARYRQDFESGKVGRIGVILGQPWSRPLIARKAVQSG
jgi:DNA invertase Pin-like site-specific DNA recombinase